MSHPTKDEQAAKRILNLFYLHWRGQVKQGISSPLVPVERAALETAFKWICQNFEVIQK